MRYIKIIGLMLLGVLGVMQFFRPSKNINPGPQEKSIGKLVAIPAPVALVLDKACNDCHSNNTRYPWYANVMPVGWILNNHVVEGKKHLNFDEFAQYPLKKQLHKLEEVAEEVEKGSMPVSGYKKMHKDARLTSEEKQALMSWALDAKNQLEAKGTAPAAPAQ